MTNTPVASNESGFTSGNTDLQAELKGLSALTDGVTVLTNRGRMQKSTINLMRLLGMGRLIKVIKVEKKNVFQLQKLYRRYPAIRDEVIAEMAVRRTKVA